EQHGNVAIRPVHEGRDDLGADDQRVADHAGADQGGGGGQRVEKTGAGGVHVHGRAAVGADTPLHAGGDVGDLVVVAGGAEHDELDVLAVDAGAGERAARRHVADLAERYVRHAP